MKKNNGFTLIELIVVIVIISIIFILTIPQIQKTSINSKIKLCQNKLSLIEDSLNLFLSTNQECYDDEDSSCYICTETKNGKCITNVERLAELGLVERDNENDVINPINKTKINDYKIAIDYNYNLEKFTSNFLSKEDENSIDSNYSSICGSNNGNGIIEGESNPSFNLKKDYNVILVKDNIKKSLGKKYEIQVAKIATFCEQTLINNEQDGDEYRFKKYEEQNDNLYCYFEKKSSPTIKINISDEDSVKISNIIKEKACTQQNTHEYTCDSKQIVEIDYSVIDGANIENISCSPNVCEKDLSNNKIKINLRYDNVLVKIETKSKYRLDYYIDNANGSDNSYQKYSKIPSTFVNTKTEAEKLCQNNLDFSIISKYTVDKEYNLKVFRCKYNRKKFKINLKTDDYVLNSNVLNGTVYKYGQIINLNFTFSEGYYFGNIDYANTTLTKENISIPDDILSVERENNTNIITFTMPSNDVDLSIISGKKYNMTVYDHYQNADNGGNYSTNVGKTNVFSIIPLDEQIDINKFCKYNQDKSIFTLNSSDNYYVKDKNEINCYYDRKLVTVNFDKKNVHINSITISPDSHSLYTSNKISEGQVTRQYRYGQNIIMRIDSYERDYEYNGVDCSVSSNCIIGLDGTTKIKAINDMTVTPKTNDIVETFKVYNHYQNTDNGDGYSTELIKEAEEVTLSNTDEKNSTTVCKKYINTQNDTFNYNDDISYLVRDIHEINCYYDRKIVAVNFDKSNMHIDSITVSPNSHVLNTSNKISEGQIKQQYRYGQNIIMRIDSYERDYEYNGVDCSVSSNCIIGLDGTTKIKAINDMTVTPKTNDIVETFKVYNHYQNTDNGDGYSTELIKEAEEVTLSNTDEKNSTTVCKKYINTQNDTFNYNDDISYLVRDIHEINCYYDRKLVNISFHKDSNISLIKYNVNENSKIMSTSDNDTKTTYRYGQNIYLFISGYTSGYIYDNIICSNETFCSIGKESAKIKADGDIDINISSIKSE